MDTAQYEAKIEKKLVEEFKNVYYQKMGFYPIVRTRYDTSIDGIGYMSLDQLEKYFTPFLPERYGQVLTLGSKHRYREIVEMRFIFCFLAKQMKYSLNTIGIHIGQRDHTTVMHALNTFGDLIQTSEGFRDKYSAILKHIAKEQELLNSQLYEPSIMEPLQDVQPESEPALLP